MRDKLEIPSTTDLGIERAHRMLALIPTGDGKEKPQSIIIRFHRYKTKEEILREA